MELKDKGRQTHYKESLGLDGVQWIIEGVKNGNYHIVDHWAPRAGKYWKYSILTSVGRLRNR